MESLKEQLHLNDKKRQEMEVIQKVYPPEIADLFKNAPLERFTLAGLIGVALGENKFYMKGGAFPASKYNMYADLGVLELPFMQDDVVIEPGKKICIGSRNSQGEFTPSDFFIALIHKLKVRSHYDKNNQEHLADNSLGIAYFASKEIAKSIKKAIDEPLHRQLIQSRESYDFYVGGKQFIYVDLEPGKVEELHEKKNQNFDLVVETTGSDGKMRFTSAKEDEIENYIDAEKSYTSRVNKIIS